MAGPLKTGDRMDQSWMAFNRLRDLQSGVMGRNETVNVSGRLYGTHLRPDVAGAAMFQIYSVEDDYLVCYSTDGTTVDTSTQIPVAKQWSHRVSLLTEDILGVTHNYTYSPGTDPNNPTRHDDDGTTTEDQIMVKPWVVGDIIWGIEAQTGVNDISGNPISLLVMADCRQWAAYDDDSSAVIDGGTP